MKRYFRGRKIKLGEGDVSGSGRSEVSAGLLWGRLPGAHRASRGESDTMDSLFRFTDCASEYFSNSSGFILLHVWVEKKPGETMNDSAWDFFDIRRIGNIYRIPTITWAPVIALMAENSHPFDSEAGNLDSAPPIAHAIRGVEVVVNPVLQIPLAPR